MSKELSHKEIYEGIVEEVMQEFTLAPEVWSEEAIDKLKRKANIEAIRTTTARFYEQFSPLPEDFDAAFDRPIGVGQIDSSNYAELSTLDTAKKLHEVKTNSLDTSCGRGDDYSLFSELLPSEREELLSLKLANMGLGLEIKEMDKLVNFHIKEHLLTEDALYKAETKLKLFERTLKFADVAMDLYAKQLDYYQGKTIYDPITTAGCNTEESSH